MDIPVRLLPFLSQFTIEVSPGMDWSVVEASVAADLFRGNESHIELLADDLDALVTSATTEEELVSSLIGSGCYYWPGEGVSYRTWLRTLAGRLRRKARGEERKVGYWRKVEPYWETVSIYDGAETFLGQYAALPKVSQVLFAAHWLQSEVCNGGFFQFFQNDTGVLAPEAVEALKVLGMLQCADIVERAMAPYGYPYPREAKARFAAPDTCWDEDLLDHLSSEFCKCISSEGGGFETVANAYVRKK